jgi:ADP-heptose:LPS heptosyltransferase
MAPSALASEAWPASHFARLAQWLIDQHGVSVWLVGSPGDRALLSDVLRGAVSLLRESLHGKIRIVQESLDVFAALIRRSRLVVANDSAPIHFADCFGIPTLYFSRHEYLPHSHPIRSSAWALFDDSENRVSRITPEQATNAIQQMICEGIVDLGQLTPEGRSPLHTRGD